ncbi:MAG: hypothetical protein ACRD4B_05495 [Acidobacteriota bacterium]
MNTEKITSMPVAMEAWQERHYTVRELAEMWGLDQSTVRAWCQDEPGVLKHGQAGIQSHKRHYITLRIPESVARRIHAKYSTSWLEDRRQRRRRPASVSGHEVQKGRCAV